MRFGILAHSAEGAALCFLTFCREGFRRMGPHMHPDVMLDCAALAHAMPAWDAGDHSTVRAILADGVQRLAEGGCDFFACPDNTAHIALERAGQPLALPGLNIGDVVAEDAKNRGMRRVAVLGTRFTMTEPFVRSRIEARGINLVPIEDLWVREVDRIIMEELAAGRVARDSQRKLKTLITELAKRKTQAVLLACTELVFAVEVRANVIPVYDTTAIHARAAVDWMLAEHEEARAAA
jgi:aspartate racemase